MLRIFMNNVLMINVHIKIAHLGKKKFKPLVEGRYWVIVDKSYLSIS